MMKPPNLTRQHLQECASAEGVFPDSLSFLLTVAFPAAGNQEAGAARSEGACLGSATPGQKERAACACHPGRFHAQPPACQRPAIISHRRQGMPTWLASASCASHRDI